MNIKYNKLIVFSVFLLIPISASAFDDKDLELSSYIDKTQYSYDEQIDIHMEAANKSDSNITLSFDDGCQMSYTLTKRDEEIGGYTIPIYNNELFERNCSIDSTQVIIPEGKKAVWTRSYIISPEFPELLPGKYLVHTYIEGYENREFSYEESTYIEFEIVYGEDGELGGVCGGIEEIECKSGLECQLDGPYEEGGVCLEDEIIPDPYEGFGNLCVSTGGDFDPCASPCDETSEFCIQLCVPECTCSGSNEWSDITGCTNSKFISELCAETNGIFVDKSPASCLCEEGKRWDAGSGCVEGTIQLFNDIEGHWGEEYIIDLQEKGIVQGYDDGGFHPNAQINRVEFLKMALSGAQFDITNGYSTVDLPFSDVEGWQVPWVQAAYSEEIVSGYDETTFAPGNNITRAEAVKVAMLTFGYEISDTQNEWAFEDTKEHWALVYINAAYLNFIISGHEDGLFHPNDPLTRAEASKIISLLIEKS